MLNFLLLQQQVHIINRLGICSTVVACWTAGQQAEQSILQQGHDS